MNNISLYAWRVVESTVCISFVMLGVVWGFACCEARPEEPRAEAPQPVEEECSHCGAGSSGYTRCGKWHEMTNQALWHT